VNEARLIQVWPYSPETDEAWAESVLDAEMGGRLQARRGELHDVLSLPGVVAEVDGERVGILTYRVDDEGCEVAVMVALRRQSGVGTALLDALRAEVGGSVPLWVVTTNDNLEALRFYQRRGFVMRALRPGAVDQARESLKPSIGRIGEHGIPLRDELELESRPERPDDPPRSSERRA
jgi:ribosomal protein S18 acetylase RimI-like enzyme